MQRARLKKKPSGLGASLVSSQPTRASDKQASEPMLFDLLRLASIGQTMELYTSLQVHQQQRQHLYQNNTSGDEQQQQQSLRQPTPPLPPPIRVQHSRPARELNQQQLQKERQLQCKPLDLSLKTPRDTAAAAAAVERPAPKQPSNRLRQNRPAALLVAAIKTAGASEEGQQYSLADATTAEVQSRKVAGRALSRAEPNVVATAAAKLISSSTSPASSSGSCSGASLSPIDTRVTGTNSGGTSGGSGASEVIISSTNGRRKKLKGAKSHLCHRCGRSFSRSDMLTRHSRLHSGLKPYQCSKCKQVFSRSDHLSTHERTHTGEKPYQCEHCAYSACRRDMITRHMRTHTGGGAHDRHGGDILSPGSLNELGH